MLLGFDLLRILVAPRLKGLMDFVGIFFAVFLVTQIFFAAKFRVFRCTFY